MATLLFLNIFWQSAFKDIMSFKIYFFIKSLAAEWEDHNES